MEGTFKLTGSQHNVYQEPDETDSTGKGSRRLKRGSGSNDSQDSGIAMNKINSEKRESKIRFLDPNDEEAEKISLAMRQGEFRPESRRKSQWVSYIQRVDMKRIMASGTFKLTLLQLARDGESETLQLLLTTIGKNQCSRMLNTSTDEEGVTALHLAAKNNHYNVCKKLIDYGSNVNIRAGESRATPLHFASRIRPKRRSLPQIQEAPENETGIYSTIPPRQSSFDDPDRNVIVLLYESGANVNEIDIEGQTPLHCASIKGNIACVNHLLRCNDINVEIKDSQGMTALHMAATHGHKDIVHSLIVKGADLHSSDNDLMTPLHFACSVGSVEIVRMLLNKARQEDPALVKQMLHRLDAGKNTGLHLAVGKGHTSLILELLGWLQTPSDVKQMVNLPRSHGDSPLHIAASQGHLEICSKLADSGADIDARNNSLSTPILLAAHHNNYEIVDFLIQRGADMESRDKDNLTPLLLASKQGHLETLSWLIENDADGNATDKHDKTCLMLAVEDQRTGAVHELLKYDSILRLMDETDKNANCVLHIAARKGYLPIIKVLLDHGAKIDSKNEDEATALHIAAQFGQHTTLKELLDHDRNTINAVDENANTALHLCAIEGHPKCVETLIEHGVNIGVRNTRQMTPLDCAASKGWEAVVLVLLQAQASVNPTKGSRTTPLHEACFNGHVQVVRLLLDWRADVGAKIADGRNPLDCAVDQDNSECVQAILQHSTWRQALRNAYIDPITGNVVTPIRKLIAKMPEMAECAFSRSITDNRKKWDDMDLEVTLDFEFLDDMYTITEWLHKGKEIDTTESVTIVETKESMANIPGTPNVGFKGGKHIYVNQKLVIPEDPNSYEAFNDIGKLNQNAVTYTRDTNMLRHNHPLMLMVSSKREGLLQHPVVTSLLKYKWNKYGGHVYYSTLMFLMVFVFLLNFYMIMIPPPYTIDFLKSLANRRFYGEFTAQRLINYTEPKPCYSLLRSGEDYRGYVRTSETNKTCIPWSDTSTDKNLYPDSGLDENYCRNPGSLLTKPWCFTNYSEENSQWTTREECDVPMCQVYIINPDLPKGTTCEFPFNYRGVDNYRCIEHPDGQWCAATYDYASDGFWGFCSEEDPYCIIPEELTKPCGSPGTDKLDCEARGCCFKIHDEGLPSEYTECVQKFDQCSDWNSYCPVLETEGRCESERAYMFATCPKSCGFCNVTEKIIDLDHTRFLYLMSTYPTDTFDPDWQDPCFYCLPGAEKKWGTGCRYKGDWETPVKIILMALCVFNLLRLILQIWNYQIEAFQPVFFLEWILYNLCLALLIDLDSFDLEYTKHMLTEKEIYDPLVESFQKETGIRQNWQWQCGVMALFLSWMNLLLYIQKIPYLGIYVVMFNDVFKTFIKFSLVFLLFILSFAFTFHTLLQNEVEFEFPFQSILKATVMMVGELDFTGIFLGGSEEYHEKVNYLIVTYIIFSIFIIVMMIIIMNLLVGLAVGDIMAVQEHATLERLKMQVELALEVEFAVPNFIRKRLVRKSAMVLPNQYRGSNALVKAIFEDKNLSTKSLATVVNPGRTENEEMQEALQQLVIYVRELRLKTNDHDSLLKELLAETREMKSTVDDNADRQQQRIAIEDEERSRVSIARPNNLARSNSYVSLPNTEDKPLPAFLRASSFRRDHRASGRRQRASLKRSNVTSAESIDKTNMKLVPSAPAHDAIVPDVTRNEYEESLEDNESNNVMETMPKQHYEHFFPEQESPNRVILNEFDDTQEYDA